MLRLKLYLMPIKILGIFLHFLYILPCNLEMVILMSLKLHKIELLYVIFVGGKFEVCSFKVSKMPRDPIYRLFATFKPYSYKCMWFIHLKSHLEVYLYVIFTCTKNQGLQFTFSLCLRPMTTSLLLHFSYILPCNLKMASPTRLKL